MRLAYVVPFIEGHHVGVERMSRTKLGIWRDMGIDAHLALIPAPSADGRAAAARSRLLGWPSRLKAIGPDVIYLRHGGTDPALALAIGRTPTVLEVHAAATSETQLPLVARARLSLGLQLDTRIALGAIFVARSVEAHPAFVRVPKHAVIPNGAVVGPVAPAPVNERPRVGFIVGTDSPWQGLDCVADLARMIPDADVVIIHPPRVKSWVRATASPRPNVLFVECPDHASYVEALRSLDVGIGPLALDRSGRSDCTPLKVVDLVSAGTPIVLTYDDTVFGNAKDPAIFHAGSFSALQSRSDEFRSFVAQSRGARLGDPTRNLADLEALEAERIGLIRSWTE